MNGPIGRLSEDTARVLIAAAFDGSVSVDLAVSGYIPEDVPADQVAAALAELRERVLR